MRQFRTALLVTVLLTLLTGLVYPLVITAIAQLAWRRSANGSLLHAQGRIVGSELIGQAFTAPGYFQPRPSSPNYDAAGSAGSNFGPSNPEFIRQVQERIARVRSENGLSESAPVPADLVLSSASGLDPDISLDAAQVQVSRICRVRGLDSASVRQFILRQVRPSFLGVFGPSRVNVLKLNLALDSMTQSE